MRFLSRLRVFRSFGRRSVPKQSLVNVELENGRQRFAGSVQIGRPLLLDRVDGGREGAFD